MTTVTITDLRERVSQLLHLALVELLALSLDHAPHRQITDLADAIENFPTYLQHQPTLEEWEMVKFCLKNYASQYPDSGWNLARDLDTEKPTTVQKLAPSHLWPNGPSDVSQVRKDLEHGTLTNDDPLRKSVRNITASERSFGA